MFPRRILGKLYLAVALGLLGVIISPLFMQPVAQAAQITNRSLTLQADVDGGSDPGGTVDHLFQFTIPSPYNAIQSIQFQYCATLNTSGVCSSGNLPAGLTTTSATLGTASAALSTFTLTKTTNGAPYLTSSTAFTPTSSTAALSVQLIGIVNPTTANQTFYVSITAWKEATPGTTQLYAGNVAASTANQIVLSGIMPESLIFCTGGTVGETGGVPDCTTATSGNISFPMLFSSTSTAYTTSQMAASTNGQYGYVITVSGGNMTTGSSSINSMNTAGASTIGTSQFGMNLEVNTTPAVGTAVTPASDGANYYAYPETGYNTANSFKFTTGDTVANSGYSTGSPAKATDSQIYTVSYIVNVPGDQPPGTYTDTLTYICTPTF